MSESRLSEFFPRKGIVRVRERKKYLKSGKEKTGSGKRDEIFTPFDLLTSLFSSSIKSEMNKSFSLFFLSFSGERSEEIWGERGKINDYGKVIHQKEGALPFLGNR